MHRTIADRSICCRISAAKLAVGLLVALSAAAVQTGEAVAESKPASRPADSGTTRPGYAAVAKAVAGATEGEWRRIVGTKLPISSGAEAMVYGIHGMMGPNAVIAGANGAWRRGHLWFFQGGGGTAYGGNERYVIDLNAGTARRLFAPARLNPKTQDPVAGMPAYRTYAGQVAHSNGRTYIWGHLAYRAKGGGPDGVWVVDDPEKNAARRLEIESGGPVGACELSNGLIFARYRGKSAILFDPKSEKIVFRHADNRGTAAGPVAVCLGSRVWMFGDDLGAAYADVDLDARTIKPEVIVRPKHALPPGIGSGVCARYHKRSGHIILWNGRREVAAFDARTNRFTAFDNKASREAPDQASTDTSAGPYTKCEIIDELDVLAGIDNQFQDAWAWKIPASLKSESGPPLQSLTRELAGLQPGAAVVVKAGTYYDGARISVANATIDGRRAKIAEAIVDGKAALVIAPDADNVTISGFEIFGSALGQNMAAIRIESPNVTIRDVVFHDNDTHVMSSGVKGGTLVIEDSRFADALGSASEPGQTHGFYLGYHDKVVARRFDLRRSRREGHNFKSRAWSSLIEDCVVAQEGAQSSRSFDFPMGGEHTIRRCVIQQGRHGNPDIFGFGHEIGGPADVRPAPSHALIVEDSLIICDQADCQLATRKHGLPAPVFRNNIIVGVRLPREMDGGGNTVFRTREEAGLPPYPAIPRLRR